MRRALSRSVAWISWVISTALLIAGSLWSGSALIAAGAAFTVLGATYPTVALMLALKRPDNPFHWVLRVIGLSFAGLGAALAYPASTGAVPDLLVASLWLSGWLYLPGVVTALTLLPLLFPNGRPPSRRWSPVLWFALLLIFVGTAAEMFAPGPLTGRAPPIDNPLGIGGPVGEAITRVLVALPLLLLVCLLLSFAAFVARFRRSRGLERAQLKWFAYVVAIVAIAFALTIGLGVLGWRIRFFTDVYLLALGGLPIAIAVAILRYRLYDIDLLINRSVVYGATSAAIAATFFVGIVALQAALRPLTSGSELAVAASTLISFALFQPIRRTIQDAVDRRFDRAGYDAARTLDAFADRLRDEVDLDALRADLLGAVERTMAPAHASVWLRGSASTAVTISGRPMDRKELA
jgi:hypothetical protein